MSRHIAAVIAAAVVASTLLGGSAWANPPATSPGQQPPANSVPPSISGAAQAGNTLTASPGTWDGKALKYAYQWQRCDSSGANCGAVAGATASTYVLSSADVGATMRVVVTASNQNGSGTATSAATAVIATAPAAPPTSSATPPSDTSAPTISGTAQQGQTLSASSGSWSGTTPMSDAYQWQRCDSAGASCAPISAATNTTYLLSSSDVGSTIRVSVTASNSAGAATATSAASGLVGSSSSSTSTTAYFVGDFETGVCPPWGHCDDYSGQGIIRQVTSPVAQGSYALQETVTPTAHASDAADSDAVYVWNNAQSYDYNGQTTWYHTNAYFPSASYSPTTGNWNWFIEHHNDAGYTKWSCASAEKANIGWDVVTNYPAVQYQVGVSPHLELRIMGGQSCSPTTKWYDFGALKLDHWYDINYVVKWDPTSAGFVNVYLDGSLVASYNGPTLYTRPDGSISYTNFELVNYRWHADWNSTIYFDNATVGPNNATVSSTQPPAQ